MDTKTLTAIVAATIAEDGDCFWDVDDLDTGVIRVRLGLNPDFSDAVTLEDLGTGAFLLEVGGHYLLPEFDYDEETQHEVVTRQTRRGLDYIHGRCSETVKPTGGGHHLPPTDLPGRCHGPQLASALAEAARTHHRKELDRTDQFP